MSSELRVNNFKARSGLGTVAVNESGLDVAGIVTARAVTVGSAATVNSTGINVVGVVTATSFKGDGSQLENLPASGDSAAKSVAIASFLGR